MRWWHVLLASAVVFAPASNASAKTLTYKFKTTGNTKPFKSYAANWTVEKKAYGPATAMSCCATTSMLTKKTFDDVSAQATVASLRFGFAGLVVRAKMSGLKLSGYAAVVTDEGAGNAGVHIRRYDGLGLTRGSGGTSTELCAMFVTKTKIDEIKLTADGKKLTLFLHGKKVCDAKDGKYKDGAVGMYGAQSEDTDPEPTVAYSGFVVQD